MRQGWPAALLFLLLIPTSQAASVHITVATPPAAPIPVDTPTSLAVTVRASCDVVAQENQVSQRTSLHLALASGYPTWITFTGDTIPFDAQSCDASTASESATCSPQPTCASDYPSVTTGGTIKILPGPGAFGLTPFSVNVIAEGEDGQAQVNLSVAWRGNLTWTTNETRIQVGPDGNATFPLSIRADTNALSVLKLTAATPPEVGTLSDVPATTEVNPPAVAMAGMPMMNMPGMDMTSMFQVVTVPLTFHVPMGTSWATANWTVTAQLSAKADPTQSTAATSQGFTFIAPPPPPPSKKSPDVDVMPLLGVVVGLVALARRRAT